MNTYLSRFGNIRSYSLWRVFSSVTDSNEAPFVEIPSTEFPYGIIWFLKIHLQQYTKLTYNSHSLSLFAVFWEIYSDKVEKHSPDWFWDIFRQNSGGGPKNAIFPKIVNTVKIANFQMQVTFHLPTQRPNHKFESVSNFYELLSITIT